MTEPLVTDHAADRWDERTSPDSVAPKTAWQRAPRSTAVLSEVRADEARYYHPQDVLLLRVGGVVATLIDVSRAASPTLRTTVRDQFGEPAEATA